MSFFDPPPPEPAEPPRYRAPEWAGPPENYGPGVAALELVLVNTGRVAVWIAGADVYPNGAVLKVAIQGREPARPGVEDGEGGWRFGVQFSNGRKASTYGLGAHARLRGSATARSTSAMALSRNTSPPEGPLLLARGGAGSRINWRQEHWLWPLPPPGDLAVACEWANIGLDLTIVTTSADVILAAAGRAQELWPDEDTG